METTKEIVAGAAKAVLAGAIAFTGAVATGFADGVMETGEWWAAGAVGLAALGVIYRVPNTGPRAPQG